MDADVHAILHLWVFIVWLNVLRFNPWNVCFWRVRRWHNVPSGVELHTIRCDLEVIVIGNAVCDSLFGLFHGFDFATFAANLLQMVKVTVGHRSDILAAKDACLEIPRLVIAVFLRNLDTGAFEIV